MSSLKSTGPRTPSKRQQDTKKTTVSASKTTTLCKPNGEEKKEEDHHPSEERNEVLEHLLKQLRPFQREAYDFATRGLIYGRQCSVAGSSCTINGKVIYNRDILGKGRILLADEMGLGKTITSLAIMAHYYPTEWPLLILCPASLRHTWPGEIEKFIPSFPASAIYVVQGFDDADFYENEWKRNRIKIVVASYSLLQLRSAAAKCLQQFEFRCVIADESHNLKQKNSQRTQLAQPLLDMAHRLVLLSGTPALARPVELWTQVSSIAPNFFAENYTEFTKRYCNAQRGRFGWDVKGLSNPDELHAKLRQIMVRRLKSDVLSELPAKQRSIVPIAIPKKERKECEMLMRQLKETRQSIDQLVGEEAEGAHFEARKLLMLAYQASGVAKASGVCDYLLEWLRGSESQKVLVFAHHKGVLDALEVAVAKEFKGRGHIRIDGTVASQERAARVKKFQNASHIRVALLSMTAAGVGLTLTAATTVMFAELHWTPGVLAQAEDRCHRIGQKNSVHVQYLVARDRELSVDMQLWDMLGRKIGNLGRVVDGEMNAHLDAELTDRPVRQSAQDELQDFFAETYTQDDSTVASKTPVKGSIVSFFNKQQQQLQEEKQQLQEEEQLQEEHQQLQEEEEQQTPKDPWSSITGEYKEQRATTKPKRTRKKRTTKAVKISVKHDSPFSAAKIKSKKVKWTCGTCTFINSTIPTISGRVKCAMCQCTCTVTTNSGDSGDEGQSAAVTPPSAESTRNSDDNDDGDVEILDTPTRSDTSTSRKDNPIALDGYVVPRKIISSQDDPIVLLDDSPAEGSISNKAPVSPSPSKTAPGSPILVMGTSHPATQQTSSTQQCIVLDDDKNDIDDLEKNVMTPSLKFSVSQNSGRITIHFAATGESSSTNFEIEQIITEESNDKLMEAHIKRRSPSKTFGISIDFNDDAIDRVIKVLDNDELKSRVNPSQLKDEIKEFVQNYLGLREVEKKALKESEQAFASANLKQTILQMMMASAPKETGNNSMERYSGGARERARERMNKSLADATDMAVLEGRLCAWCGGELPAVFQLDGVDGTYCKRECAERGRLNTSTGIREQLFALEGGVCRLCGIDAYALFTRVSALQPAERLNALCNAKWRLPMSARALDKLLQNPKEADFWEADHIIPVSEGGGSCGLENIRTLCVPCHQEETKKLRARLKLNGGPTSSQNPDNCKKRQRDIRSMFQAMPPTQNSSKRIKATGPDK